MHIKLSRLFRIELIISFIYRTLHYQQPTTINSVFKMEEILFSNINPPCFTIPDEFNHTFLNFDMDVKPWISSTTNNPDITSTSNISSNDSYPVIGKAESWLLQISSDYIHSNNESIFTVLELAKETISIYKLSETQKDVETHFQDKMFQLLGETCFEFLGNLLSDFSLLNQLTIESIVNAYKIWNTQTSTAINNLIQSESSSSSSQNIQTHTNNTNYNISNDPNEDYLRSLGFSEEYLYNERLLGLQKGKTYTDTHDNMDHWKDELAPEGTLVYHEKKGLPQGTEKKTGSY